MVQELAGCSVATVVLRQGNVQFTARQLALSRVCGYRLLVLLFGQGGR